MNGGLHTIRCASIQAVGLILCFLCAGCASQNFHRTSSADFTATSPPHEYRKIDPIPAQAQHEIAAPATSDIETESHAAASVEPQPAQPAVSPVVRARISPALTRMVEELDAAIDACPRSAKMDRAVSLAHMRNMSHANAREFDAVRARLAELLNAAAASSGSTLHFIASDTEPASFDLLGAGYLATLDGFDAWELFLSVSRRDVPYDLWRSDGPVRVLRFEQPMSAQVFYPGSTPRQ